MRKKSFVMITSFLFMVFLLLSGCQSKNQDLDGINDYSIPVNDTGNSFGNVQNSEITYIYTPTPSIELSYNEDFKEVVSKVQERMLDQYRVKINMEFIPGHQYYEIVSKRLQANDSIDVFSPHPSQYPGLDLTRFDKQYYLQQWINTFEIADLTDYVDIYYPRVKEYINDPEIREAVVYNDRIFGIPGISQYMQGNLLVLAVYKEYYESIEKPPIETIDDLYRLIQSVEGSKYKNKGRIICSFDDFLSWHCGNNGLLYFSNLMAYQGKNVMTLENEAVLQEAFLMYQDLSERVLLAERNVPGYWSGKWDLPGADDIDVTDELTYSPILIQISTYDEFSIKTIRDMDRFSDEYEVLFLNNPCTVTYDLYSLNYLINGASSKIEPSLFFLNCLETDEEIYDLLRYGIKDKHYRLNDEGAVSLTDHLFTGWDSSDRLISRNMERPLTFELKTQKSVWEDFIRKPNHVFDGVDTKKLLRIIFDYDVIDSDLSRMISNRSAFNLFKDYKDSDTKINTMTGAVKAGIRFEDFIRLYNENEGRAIVKALQEIIDG